MMTPLLTHVSVRVRDPRAQLSFFTLLIIGALTTFLVLFFSSGGSSDPPDWDNGYIDHVDQDLFRRAMERPVDAELAEPQGPPKVAFLFLVRGPLPLERYWDRFFQGHEGRYSVYVHASIPDFDLDRNVTSPVFHGRQIPAVKITWGGPNLIRAERRLLAAALADPRNERFVLLSESCLPLFNFSYVYDYLFEGNKSFVASYPSTWRYRSAMAPLIPRKEFRKGSQWFALTRKHAAMVVNDKQFYELFVRTNAEIPDESYIQTIISLLDKPGMEPRSVLYVHWYTTSSPHPMSYSKKQVTKEFIRSLQQSQFSPPESSGFMKLSAMVRCTVAGRPTHCYLFARKFEVDAVPILLNMTDVIGF